MKAERIWGDTFMRKALVACVIFLLIGGIAAAQNARVPSVEDLRGALFVCSGGQVQGQTVSGSADVEAFIGLLRRNLGGSLDVKGSTSTQDIGKIFEQTFDEGERYEVFKLYNECLQNFVLPIVSGSGGSGPGIQALAAFSVIVHEAYEIDDLVVVTAGLSGFVNSGTRKLGIVKSSFRGISSTGTIYTLGDVGGLQDCPDEKTYNRCGVGVKKGDNLTVILTFEKAGGRAAEKTDGKKFSFSGQAVMNTEELSFGIREIPLVPLDE